MHGPTLQETPVLDITAHVNALADRVHALRPSHSRILVGLAGAPGSGKSTLAAELSRRLNAQKIVAEVVPMDGFHLDNAILDARGQRARKGSPETFDAVGFVHLIKRLQARAEVIVPVFDRTRDLAIAGATVVPADCEVVIVEGNYLLFNQAPWDQLKPLWTLSAQLDVPLPELRARLIQRWLSLGLSRAAATRRAESNDIPNAVRVIELALPADLILQTHPTV
jgi:pantothenate kinase